MANPSVNTDYQISSYASGTAGLVTLFSLGIHNPMPVWKPAVNSVKLGNNAARALGSPIVIWQWGFIGQNERDILRTYCTGVSAMVYIYTPTTEKISGVSNAAKRYLAQMIWETPDKAENPQAGRRLDFSVLFRQLVAV